MRRLDRVDEVLDQQKKQTQDEEFYDSSEDRPKMLKDEMEKGDLFAMIVSAWFIFVPLCIIILLVMVFGAMLLLGLF